MAPTDARIPPLRGLLIPAIFTLTAIAVFVGLGTWQVQRLHWKQGLIAQIEARANASPVSLDDALAQWAEKGEVEYLRVRFGGTFQHDDEQYLYWVADGKSGWRVITPLDTDDGQIVLVDRGWVPDALKDPDKRGEGQVEGEQVVTGLARAPGEKGAFTPDNKPGANEWYWRDLEEMGKAALEESELVSLVPFFVEAEASDVPGGWPKGGITRLALHNRHLEYALTWYGLAAALAVVFAFFARSRLR